MAAYDDWKADEETYASPPGNAPDDLICNVCGSELKGGGDESPPFCLGCEKRAEEEDQATDDGLFAGRARQYPDDDIPF